MSETRRIICDARRCGRDITEADHPGDGFHRLEVRAERRLYLGVDGVACLEAEPPIEGNRHFCGLACLKAWAAGQA